MNRTLKVLLAFSPLVLGLYGAASPEREPIYDESADAKDDISKAVARAKKDNKRVLVVWGGNWCGWCYKLHDVFKTNKPINRLLRTEYEVVRVDIGRWDKNKDLLELYGVKLRGVPFLTLLDGGGKPVVHQETGSLEKGDRHDPEKVQAFLEKWKAKPVDAEHVLKVAGATAKKENKRLLVHLGAPW